MCGNYALRTSINFNKVAQNGNTLFVDCEGIWAPYGRDRPALKSRNALRLCFSACYVVGVQV